MIKARRYQKEAMGAVIRDWDDGYRSLLLTMATGTGKTYVFLSILHSLLRSGERALIIAHRKELIEQPLDRLHSYYPEFNGKAGIVMADIHEPDKQIIIGTVQSLVSERRMSDILENGKIDYLICDECHHATSQSYRNVYDALKKENDSLRYLGVTATPIRADGDGLSGVYEKESYHYGISEGISGGYLVPVKWLAIQTRISVDKIAKTNGDFVQRQLKDVFETDNCFDLVVESHKKYAGSRQAIAFTVTVEGAYKLRDAFNKAGISAVAVDGKTNKHERKQIFNEFIDGKHRVFCNVGIATEGVDIPSVSCIHQVRPTMSDSLYTQMMGRSLRLYPGKDDALIIDYCPVEARNVAMAGDVLGVPLRKDSYVKDVDESGETAGGFLFDGKKFHYATGDPAEIISRQLDYLDLSPWAWYRKDGWMSLGLGEASDGKERTLVVSPPNEGEMTLYGVSKNGHYPVVYKITVGTWDEISEISEDYANKYGNATLASKQRKWRRQAATDKQIKYARRIKGAYTPGMKKGELAKSITHHLAVKEVEFGSVVDITGR